MSHWNKHGGGPPPGKIPPNITQRIPRPSSEDGEIGEEEGEIIAGVNSPEGGSKGIHSPNMNSNSRQDYPSAPYSGGGNFYSRRESSLSAPRRSGPWGPQGRGGGGMGGRGIGGPPPSNFGQRGLGRGGSGRPFGGHTPPPSSGSLLNKPDPVSRSQTFSSFSGPRVHNSNLNSSNPPPSSQHPHQYPSAPGPSSNQIRSQSIGTVPSSGRATDPRFRGSDVTTAAIGSKLAPIKEGSLSGSSAAPPMQANRGLSSHHQQQVSINHHQPLKEIGSLASSRDPIRRESINVARTPYNALADISDTGDSSKGLANDRREPPLFQRGERGIIPSSAEHMGAGDGSFNSPRRAGSRDSISHEVDVSNSAVSSTASTRQRSENSFFRGGSSEAPETNLVGRPTQSLPIRDTYRSDHLPSEYGGRSQRDTFRGGPSSETGAGDGKSSSGSGSGFGPPLRGGSHLRDSFRGPMGRRHSDFRGGFSGDDSSIRNVSSGITSRAVGGSTDSGDNKYYASTSGTGGTGTDFRRSPLQQRRSTFSTGRDGTGIPPLPIGRAPSFTSRRNEGRFPYNSSYEDRSSSFNDDLPGSSGEVDTQSSALKTYTVETSSEQIEQSFSKLADGDPFGRSRDWLSSTGRRSPQMSPQSRRTPVSFGDASSPKEQTSSTFASLGISKEMSQKESIVTTANDSTASNDPMATSAMPEFPFKEKGGCKEPEKPTIVPEDRPPSPLDTSLLGENDKGRAEKVIAEVLDILQCEDLTSKEQSELTRLPSNQQILKALAILDVKLKSYQKEIEEKKAEVVDVIKQDEDFRAKAKEEAISDARRQEEERVQREEGIWAQEETALDFEIEGLTSEKLNEIAAERELMMVEFEDKLRKSSEQEEQKLKENLNQQIVMTADNFDKDIAKVKKDLERSKQIAAKTESKLSAIEADIKSKAETAKDEVQDAAPQTVDLISRILSENKRRAAEAHLFQFVNYGDHDDDLDSNITEIEERTDPKVERSISEWAQLAQQVTCRADALYKEPSDAPYYQHNELRHALLEPLVAEYVRDKVNRLNSHWTELAEEYEIRRMEYETALPVRKKKTTKSSNLIERYSILGAKPTTTVLESGVRTSANPYRRARRGNEVRSEYEQEQVIAELNKKEAMQKRITFGGCDVPRQITNLEKSLTCSYRNTFLAQKVDMLEQENDPSFTNVWTDMEKCIFLDRFMQHPKDFRKIASFLRNKTTSDCIRFYYDSKQTVPYKHALRDHIMRRKRRGDYHVWDATVEAALSVGAHVEAGVSEDKPLVFHLPENDHTYFTRSLHPLKREVFDSIDLHSKTLDELEEELSDDDYEPKKNGKTRKRAREPLFVLGIKQRKFLKVQETTPSVASNDQPPTVPSTPLPSLPVDPVIEIVVEAHEDLVCASDSNANDGLQEQDLKDESGMTPARKAPQKWTAEEKKIFIETLAQHGKNWPMLSQAVGSKSISQIKNYFYDYKKQENRHEKKVANKSSFDINPKSLLSKSRDDNSSSPQPNISHAPTPPETPVKPSIPENVENDLTSDVIPRREFSSVRKGEKTVKGKKSAEKRPVNPKRAEQITSGQGRFDEERERDRKVAASEQTPLSLSAPEQKFDASKPKPAIMIREHDNLPYGWPNTGQQPFHESSTSKDVRSTIQNHAEVVERGQSIIANPPPPESITQGGDIRNFGTPRQNNLMSEEEAFARRLLQQHNSHSQHHQQILSSLLPWVGAGQQPTNAVASSAMPEWSDPPQHLQNLLRLHQQQLQSQQQQQQLQSQQQQQQLQSQQQQQQLQSQQQQQQQQLQNQQQQQLQSQQQQQLQSQQQQQLQSQQQQQLQSQQQQQLQSQQQQQIRGQQQQLHAQQQLHRQPQPNLHHQRQYQSQLAQQNPISNLVALANLANPSILAALGQQRSATEEAQLALAQHFLGQQGDTPSARDAYGLLFQNNNNSHGNFPGPGNPGNR